MGSNDARRGAPRTRTIESLEERRVMSAEPIGQLLGGSVEQHWVADVLTPQDGALDEPTLEQHGGLTSEAPSLIHHTEQAADFWIDSWSERDLDALLGDLELTLASAHNSTGLTTVRNDYGFIGTGQTVAVIDSGIAWDHSALGGGFGANYRVVGGWDFTGENDANPYDDGPAGSHGTHVAGIVGADRTGTNDDGVAPGVDLVGLRVFNDDGAGYFNWVENALRWVHQNRNAFANPITAVNLSLGTSWNSSTVPNWTTLEDEFAQLKADGIFVAVSAGNSFATYNTPGLSYPAASPYVVPVMSVDDSGNLSSFSQRHTRAIAAPGRYIVSTVPDYVGNHNGVTDDYASYSGTSMAAPYIAGASVLVREAMQFVGYTNITQDTIYNHLMATATTFFDAATSQNYKRINVANALNSLMPTDDYGSTVAGAFNLGTLSGTSEMSGLIGKLSDADYFRFTAAATGTVSFTATTTHTLAPIWSASAGVVSGNYGETYTFDVVAGQSYSIGLSTGGGIGYYDLAITAESAFSYVDWGTITQTVTNDITNTGESWYRLQASRAGYLTAEALFASASGNINLGLYDSNLQLLSAGATTASGGRVDVLASMGSDYFLRVTGTNADIDFRLTNLVSQNGTTVNVAGTAAADTFTFAAGATQHTIGVNGATYQFNRAAFATLNFAGGAGNDTITMTGSAGNETATLRVGSATLAGLGFTAVASGVENVTVNGGGGNDTAYLYDSAGDDYFYGYSNRALFTGTGFANTAWNFARVYAYASQGTDKAFFYDTAGDDVYAAWSNRAVMYRSGYWNEACGFDRTYAYATGGNDRAVFYDTAGDDVYGGWSDRAVMYGNDYFNYARNFDRTLGYASQGNDKAYFYDTAGDDVYGGWSDRAVMYGNDYFNYARNFDRTYAYATQGNDKAYFYDSAGDDVYGGWSDRAVMYGNDYFNYACGFDKTIAYSTAGGYDLAYLYDSVRKEALLAAAWGVRITSDRFWNEARGFKEIIARLTTGDDQVDIGTTDYVFELLGS